MKIGGRKSRWISRILIAAMLFGNGIPVYAEEKDHVMPEGMSTGTTGAREGVTAEEENSILPEELGYVPGEILVVYKEDISETQAEQITENLDGEVVETIAQNDGSPVAVVSISDETSVSTALEEYMEDSDIVYAEPNYLMDAFEVAVDFTSDTMPDPEVSKQWYLDYVHAPEAWEILKDYDGEKVRVGVIDTGARMDHEDLSGVINPGLSVELVRNAVDSSYSTQPLRGDGYLNGTEEQNSSTIHGTHVTGILAAQSGNGTGIQGVASGGSEKPDGIVDIVAIDAFTMKNVKGEDAATVADVVYAMKYAEEQGCRVVNLSLGTTKESSILKDTCDDLKNTGVTIVCAAGNSGTDTPIYPSDYDSTIGVINIDPAGNKSSESNYGEWKSLSAPGTNMYSTTSRGTDTYGYLSGTSMAAPVVSAAAAMLLYAVPDLTPEQVTGILCETATDLMGEGKDIYTGYGAVNIGDALKKAVGETDTGGNGGDHTGETDPGENGGDDTGGDTREDTSRVIYRCHAQTYGWMDWMEDGASSGTTGEAKRLEAIQISLQDQAYPGDIEYCTHVQTYGWQDWSRNGEDAGTTGQSKRMEAVRIRLTGEMAEHYDIYYRVHVQTYGWLDWTCNGAVAGTSGLAKRMEAVEIQLVEKGGEAPGSVGNAFIHPLVQYQTHVQTYGWQAAKYDGAVSGTAGEAKRLEAIKITLPEQEKEGDILYRTHVQTYGWQDFVSNGEVSGTTGEAKRLEAIEILLTGELEQYYDIYYRVHVQTYGWLGWAKNGEPAGTAGMAKRMEAIEIVLVEKDGRAPGSTEGAFFDKK